MSEENSAPIVCIKGPSGKCEPPPDVITGGLSNERSDDEKAEDVDERRAAD